MIINDIKRGWRIVRRVAMGVLGLVVFFTLMELIRAYQTLRAVHPLVGYCFLAIFAGLGLYGLWRIRRSIKMRPRVLIAPPCEKYKKYGRYLLKYMERLEDNRLLDETYLKTIAEQRSKLQACIDKKSDRDTFTEAINQAETQGIQPALVVLDKLAEEKIRDGVRDIMLAVTLSPYRSIDLMIVLYRNVAIVQNVAKIYNSRPRFRENVAIICDTIRVVATVNFVNLGTKMLENVSHGLPGIIPGVSRIIDDCTEGLAAGLLTSVTGHAAKERCRAFRQWNYEEAKNNIARHLKTFTSDVGKMFFRDIIPQVKIPGGIAIEKWKEVKDGVVKGFGETVGMVQDFVKSRAAKG